MTPEQQKQAREKGQRERRERRARPRPRELSGIVQLAATGEVVERTLETVTTTDAEAEARQLAAQVAGNFEEWVAHFRKWGADEAEAAKRATDHVG